MLTDVATVQFKQMFKSPEWMGEEVWIGNLLVGRLYTFYQEKGANGMHKLLGSHLGATRAFEDRRKAVEWFTRIYHAMEDAL